MTKTTYTHTTETTYRLTKKEKIFWQNECTNYVHQFLKDCFNDTSLVPIYMNHRMSKNYAQLIISDEPGFKPRIEINTKIIKACQLVNQPKISQKFLEGLLRHEAIHYILWKNNCNFNDGDDDFENYLHATNTNSSGATPNKHIIQRITNPEIMPRFHTICPKCQNIKLLKTKGKYHCAYCQKTHNQNIIIQGETCIIGIYPSQIRGEKLITKKTPLLIQNHTTYHIAKPYPNQNTSLI